MKYTQISLLVVLIGGWFSGIEAQLLNIIKDRIQYNIIGLPLVHTVTVYNFDPNVAVKRRKQFEKLNGRRADALIERLGLGIDGDDDIRLFKQRERDEGKLGGVNYYLSPQSIVYANVDIREKKKIKKTEKN